jgi:hypothetical protein
MGKKKLKKNVINDYEKHILLFRKYILPLPLVKKTILKKEFMYIKVALHLVLVSHACYYKNIFSTKHYVEVDHQH